MKNLFNKLCILLFIAHFIACSHDAVDEMSVFTEDGTVVNTFKVSENEARETLMSFLDRFDTSSSGGAGAHPKGQSRISRLSMSIQ